MSQENGNLHWNECDRHPDFRTGTLLRTTEASPSSKIKSAYCSSVREWSSRIFNHSSTTQGSLLSASSRFPSRSTYAITSARMGATTDWKRRHKAFLNVPVSCAVPDKASVWSHSFPSFLDRWSFSSSSGRRRPASAFSKRPRSITKQNYSCHEVVN